MKIKKIGQNKTKLIKKWWRELLFVLIVIIFPVLALIVRGKNAFQGVFWGYSSAFPLALAKQKLCQTNDKLFNTFCRFDKSNLTVNFGVYDPNHTFAESEKVAVEHFYINWVDYDQLLLKADLGVAFERNRWPMITVEPYSYETNGLTEENLFEDIIEGKYDQPITSICNNVREFNQPLFLRWGHEMENITGRYPWAKENYQGYINAYRHFVNRCRLLTDNAYYVWSPVGKDSLGYYWPGKEYVDYVGLSVYGFPEWERDYYQRARSFEEIFSEKYQRVKNYGQPVMIAELGVTGGEEYQQWWLNEAFSSLPDFPLLKTIVYFNAVDTPGVWGSQVDNPNWQIDPKYFD